MKKRLLALIVALLTLALPSAAENQTGGAADGQEAAANTAPALTASQQKNIIREFAHTMSDNYYYGINDQELLYNVICSTIDNGGVFDVDKALKAMVNALGDDYAEFYSPEDYVQQTQYFGAEHFGIGVVMTLEGGRAVIETVYSDSAAEAAGIKVGDEIAAVDGADTSDMSLTEISGLIMGDEGSPVEITLRRGEETLNVIAVRQRIVESHSSMNILNGDIAYIDVDSFTRSLPEEFDAYLGEIAAKSIDKVIIDLRDNGGGERNAAIEVAQKLISAGLICKFKYKDESLNEDIYSENLNAPRFKLLVLVNKNTASASELLAMALQSRGRAKLMGTETYGKGSMQLMMQCVTGSGLKFTIGEFFSPNDERVNTVGLTPDIEVENRVETVDESQFAEINLLNIDLPVSKLGVEQRLGALGLLPETYVDGNYDSLTGGAIKAFQQICGMEPTGTADFNTVLALNDYEYNITKVVDVQMEEALKYFD